jgi:hypothetical protein
VYRFGEIEMVRGEGREVGEDVPSTRPGFAMLTKRPMIDDLLEDMISWFRRWWLLGDVGEIFAPMW